MTAPLRYSPELALPLDAVTQRFAFLGRIGSGKTYGATKLAELMLDAGAQVVALDPVGLWYGLRVAGKGAGYPVTVLGGLHGDLPLQADSGAFIADLIVDRGLSCVLDVSQFESDAAKARFAEGFAKRFFFRKKSAPSAVHVFLEECQEFVPQNPQQKEADMLHEWTRMAKLGRNFGIGLSLISQRPQEVNKKVLNLTECLVAFQMTGAHERKAIREWIATVGADENILNVLPSLPVGVAHVYSPQWLRISQQIKAAPKRTADVSSTPLVGASPVDVKPLTKIDLVELRGVMAATIEKAKADDPKELRKEITSLKAQLAASAKTMNSAASVVGSDKTQQRTITRLRKAVEAAMKFIVNINAQNFDVAGVDKAELERAVTAAVGKATQIIDDRLGARAKTIENLRASAQRITEQLQAVLGDEDVVVEVAVARNEPFSVRAPAAQPATRSPAKASAQPSSYNGEPISAPQQRILNTLALFKEMGSYPVNKSNVAVFSEASPTSSSFANNLGRLRTLGLIDYPEGGVVALTTAGETVASVITSIASLKELRAAWSAVLPAPQSRLIEILADRHPSSLDRNALADLAGASSTSSSYANNLGALRSLGLIDYGRDRSVHATNLLFPEGLN
ncbi:MAG: hypothetical protein JWM95_3297 [Gemmatimonadetes bacterium]|nr:hypothetical protein [Gemmatimonadota bacterium]